MPGARSLGWMGPQPSLIGQGLSEDLSAAVFRIDQSNEAEVSVQIPPDTYFVCATLSGSIDWDARLTDRRVTRPCRPGAVDMGYPGEAAQIRYSNARARIVHFYLPRRWFLRQVDELAPSARHSEIELIDPMHSRCVAVSRHGELIVDALCRGDSTQRLEIESIGLSLAATLVRLHSNITPRIPARGGLTRQQQKRVTDYVSANLGEDIALADLAAICELSPHHFCRAFKQSMGLTPFAWLTQQRIDRAKELIIAHPSMGLLEIALCVGYQSQAAFGTAFQRTVGAAPGKWRRARD